MNSHVNKIKDYELQTLLTEYEKNNGVIDFGVYSIADLPEIEAHYLTALQTLYDKQAEIDERMTDAAITLGTSRDTYFKMTIDPDFKHTGKRISIEPFLGLYCDVKSKRSIVRGETDETINNFYYYDAPEILENIIPWANRWIENSPFVADGFAYAFLHPPLRLYYKKVEAGEFFIRFCNYFFDDFEKLIIYRWGVDQSNYFDDGKEYWGSFLWTVYNPVKNWYIGIAVSATD